MQKEIAKLMSMLPFLLIWFILGAFFVEGLWAQEAQVRPGEGPDIEQAQAERYDGPKARMAVADFEDKMSGSGQYRAEYGRGMADMLATALFHTNRYIVLERQKLSYIIAEQDLGASGRVKRETAAAIGELEGAELLVVAAVTGFDPGTSGGGGSLGIFRHVPGIGGAVGSALGSIAGGFKTAHMAIDLRVVDTRTGRVLSATSVEGSATDYSGSLGAAGTSFAGALGGFAKTPMEKAIRDVIQGAVNFVVSKTPKQYYRHGVVATAAPPVPELQPGAPAASPQPQMGPAGPQPQMALGFQGSPQVPTGVPQPPAGFMPQVPSIPQPQVPTEMANIPPPSLPSLALMVKSIAAEKNPKLAAELTEVKKRGAVISVVVTVRNTTNTKQQLEYSQQGTHLLDYAEGKKYDLISGIQGKRTTTLGPNEQAVIRAAFKAPPKAETVAIFIGDIGSFDDVSLGK